MAAMVFREKTSNSWILVCVLNFASDRPGPRSAYVFHMLPPQSLPEVEKTTQAIYSGKALTFLYPPVSPWLPFRLFLGRDL